VAHGLAYLPVVEVATIKGETTDKTLQLLIVSKLRKELLATYGIPHFYCIAISSQRRD
jgi:hypothetical protein